VLRVLLIVGVTRDFRFRVPLLLNAVQAGAQRRCQCQVGVAIGGPESVLDTLGLVTAGDNA